jgi:Zn-dependent peptidase ImmA (M78 family)
VPNLTRGRCQVDILPAMRRPDLHYTAARDRAGNWSRIEVEDFGAKVSKNLGFSAEVDIVELVQTKLQGRIHYKDYPDVDPEGGTIYVHGPRDFDMLIPASTSPIRDRFTIAHELGHYFLHAMQGKFPIVANRSGFGQAEAEANSFAAGFLMPADVFRDEAERAKKAVGGSRVDGEVVEIVAARLGVSRRAAELRARALKLS